MRRVAVFSLLLIAGMIGAQMLPGLGDASYAAIGHVLRLVTMVTLSFIMIHLVSSRAVVWWWPTF